MGELKMGDTVLVDIGGREHQGIFIRQLRFSAEKENDLFKVRLNSMGIKEVPRRKLLKVTNKEVVTTKNLLSKADAIRLLHAGKTVKSETSNGHISIKKRPAALFETRVYTKGSTHVTLHSCNFPSLLLMMDGFTGYYV